MKRKLLKQMTKAMLIAMITLTTQVSFAQVLGENMLLNPGFEEGVDDWGYKFYGGIVGTLTLDTENAHSGQNSGKVTITTGGNLNKGMLLTDSIMDIELKQYYFKCFFKSHVSGIVKFGIQQTDETGAKKYPGFVVGKEFDMTTEYQEFRSFFTPRIDYSYITQVRMQMGDTEGDKFFDDFEIREVNDMYNKGFEDEQDFFFGWRLDTSMVDGAAAVFSEETTDVTEGASALKVEVASVIDTIGDVAFSSLYQHFPKAGGTNTYEFDAKASTEGDSIWAMVNFYQYEEVGDTWAFLYAQADSFKLTTDYAKYSMEFVMPDTIHYVRYRILCGNDVGTYHFDNFNIIEYAVPEITSTPDTTAINHELYEYQLEYSGTGTFTVGSYPEANWLSISETGLLSGTPDAAGEYGISVKLDDGLNSALHNFTLVVDPGVSIENNIEEQISMYPNPANSILTVEGERDAQFSIIDITGKEVLRTILDSDVASIDISEIKSGLYIVNVRKDNERKLSKLVVK